MSSTPTIMVVEDDENLGFLIKDSLSAHGWNVQVYRDGEKGLSAFHSHTFDLCVLDVMLPLRDGFDIATEIRRYNQHIPIIFLTARNQTDDRIKGFRAGADDYVCKPFSIEEFKYRIQAILKRTSGGTDRVERHGTLKAGNSTLDVNNLVLNSNGTTTQLTYKEGKVLELLFRHCNSLVERDVFLKTVWESEGFFVARSMDVFVSRLRKFLRDDPRLRIDNVRGVGYVLKDTAASLAGD
jgi:two-component system, OmpR family, response regulator